MYQRRKKFTKECSPEKRLSDRWEQQVFFISRKFPQAAAAITAIMKSHADGQGSGFTPSEAALTELANLYAGYLG